MAKESKLIQTSRFLKKVAIIFLVIIILNIVWGFASKYISSIKDNIDNPINFSAYFDEDRIYEEILLPELGSVIPKEKISNAQFSIKDDFNYFPERIFVYKTNIPKETFLTVTKAEQFATELGFTEEYDITEPNTLLWTDVNQRELRFNKVNLSWDLDPSINLFSNIQDEIKKEFEIEQTLKTFNNKIQSSNLELTNYDLNNPQTLALNYPAPNYIMELTDEDESEYLMLNYFRKLKSSAVDEESSKTRDLIQENNLFLESKIYIDNPFLSDLNFTINKNLPQLAFIIDFNYKPLSIDTQTIGVYSVITPQLAFQYLQNEKGYLRSLTQNQNDILKDQLDYKVTEFQIESKQTELAYYIQEGKEGYTYPIYLFRGKAYLENGEIADFIFYVDALYRS
ncbi:hypothetical protein GF362_05010 [Candidatus Dojkabacteria bacterium]|nr:hypothetical protein [Candidatus Dojkabacteria bacterium]